MGRPVVHFEIGCKNKDKTEAFYSKLFDWKVESSGEAGMIDTGSEAGILGHITSLGHEPHNYVTFYVDVDDLEGYMKRAEDLGGKTLVGPIDISQSGSFAWIADPDGNIVGLWKAQS